MAAFHDLSLPFMAASPRFPFSFRVTAHPWAVSTIPTSSYIAQLRSFTKVQPHFVQVRGPLRNAVLANAMDMEILAELETLRQNNSSLLR